jgi:eukaryotic-like serine/threonine-protein kinase
MAANRRVLSYLVAAAFVANLLLTLSVWVAGPESSGITIAWFARPVVVQRVAPDSPAMRAGIRPGDRLVSAARHPIGNLDDWRRIATNIETGRPLHLKLERRGAPIERDLVFRQRSLAFWISATSGIGDIPAEQGNVQLVFIAASIVYVVLAVLILLARPGDTSALLGALFLGVCCALSGWPEGSAVAWRHAPWVIQPLLWVNELNLCVGFGVLVTFVTLFPRPLPRARLILLVAWLPDLIIQPWLLRLAFDFIYRPDSFKSLPDWLNSAITMLWVVYMIAVIGLATANYRRLKEPNERRRVRLIFAGLCIAIAANLPRIAFAQGPLASTPLASIIVSPAASIPAGLASLSIPISFAIAITRDRLFDIRILIRQGVRYAIARGILLSIAPALALVLGGDLALHAEQPLSSVLQERGWIYASIATMAITAHMTRRRWLGAIDRHFFREKYNAERLLRESVEVVRHARDFVEGCGVMVSRVETALHPEFVGVFVRDGGERKFHMVAGAGTATRHVHLRPEIKVLSLARVLGKCLDASGGRAGWLKELPPDEIEWIEQESVELFIPIPGSEDRHEAFMLLGRKKSEEPYSRDDREILQAIAVALALCFARVPGKEIEVRSFRECPTCGACEASDESVCAKDGSSLVGRNFARVLAGRYRIEQRIGSGGMGTVYEAADLVLRRRVAVKLIREELAASSAAIARFEQEARIAAKFSHPNVVTVFDFGVTDNTMPFLVMELLRGGTLRNKLRTEGRIEVGRTLSILGAVCAGVHSAHQHGLIHRDLKPENIFLTRGDIKILDFGLSKFLAPELDDSTASTMTLVTAAGAIAGTLDYMAPEQLDGAAPSVGWDIWALGVISYEMLTSTRPFAATDAISVRTAIRQGNFIPISATMPRAPERLSRPYEQVFSSDPGRRPTSAMVFLEELSAAFSDGARLNRVASSVSQ